MKTGVVPGGGCYCCILGDHVIDGCIVFLNDRGSFSVGGDGSEDCWCYYQVPLLREDKIFSYRNRRICECQVWEKNTAQRCKVITVFYE